MIFRVAKSTTKTKEGSLIISDQLIESNKTSNNIHFILIKYLLNKIINRSTTSRDNIKITIGRSRHILVKKIDKTRNKIFNLIKFKAITLIRSNTTAKNKLDKVIIIKKPIFKTKLSNKKSSDQENSTPTLFLSITLSTIQLEHKNFNLPLSLHLQLWVKTRLKIFLNWLTIWDNSKLNNTPFKLSKKNFKQNTKNIQFPFAHPFLFVINSLEIPS